MISDPDNMRLLLSIEPVIILDIDNPGKKQDPDVNKPKDFKFHIVNNPSKKIEELVCDIKL
jgi:hypothetical protein